MQTNSNTPVVPAEQLACDHLRRELAAARKSARRTRLGCLVAMAFVTGYMTFLVVTLHTRLFAPQPAAQIVTSYAINAVDSNLDRFDDYVRTEVPAVMRETPDILLDRLPVIRATIESQLEAALRTYATDLSTQLGEHLDTFIAENDDALRQFFAQAHDPAFVTAFGNGLEAQLRTLLTQELASGQTVSDHLQESLQAVQQLESRFNRLAYAKDLTPHEQRLKQVIAVTMRLTEQTL